ncbi:MAG: class I adenylate-forming enzyme family protein [Vampirovibrionales bacterium]
MTPIAQVPHAILTCFHTSEEALGEHPWLYEDTHAWTLTEIREEAQALAIALQHQWHLQAGDRVALCLSNQKSWWVSFYALRLLGVVAVPMNLQLGITGMMYVLGHAQVQGVLAEAPLLQQLLSQPAMGAAGHPTGHTVGQALVASGGFPYRVGVFVEVVSEALQEALSPLGENITFYLKDKKAQTTEALTARLEAIAQREAPSKEDIAVILYTSGSTGTPKGVPLSEYNLLHNMAGFSAQLGLDAPDEPEPWMLLALPLFHSFGFMCGLYALSMKARVVLVPKFSPKAILQALHTHPITVLPLVPTFFSLLLDAGKALLKAPNTKPFPHLNYCISGGAALPVRLLDTVEQQLGVVVLEGYGLTETSPVLAVNTPKRGRVPHAVGQILPNVALRLEPLAGSGSTEQEACTDACATWYYQPNVQEASPFEGQIVVKGPNLMAGYLDDPVATEQAFTQDGWFKTGDIGRVDAEGNLYISGGRIKDLIIKAGENIAPMVIEHALAHCESIAEVAVIGEPHVKLGESIVAYVVRHEKDTEPSDEACLSAVKQMAKHTLPALYQPDRYEVLETLPKTATGKIDKQALRQRVTLVKA